MALGAVATGILVAAAAAGAWLKLRQKPPAEPTPEELRQRELMKRVVPARERDRWLGKTMGPYLLVELLGRGGMASVYRAELVEPGENDPLFAIKLLNNYSWFVDGKFRERFEREASVCSRLRHPSIVALYEAGAQGESMYLVMELARGQTLRSLIAPGGLPLERALSLLTPVVDGLAFAHEQGIVHRDLKPENIMVCESGEVKLMDFGLAKAQDSARVTETGSVLGTLAYISPEQIQGKGYQAASDQYALGVILYELLTGSLPFRARKAMEVVMQHLHEEPPSVVTLKPELPASVEVSLRRMLAKDPAERFPDVREALQSLRA